MENLSTKRDKIIKSLFQNELSNIQEELDAIKEAGTNPENVCSQINWDAKDLEGKTKEEVDIINSIETHQNIIKGCDEILQQLNPEIVEKQRQEQENKALREEINSLKEMFREFIKSSLKSEQHGNDN